MISRSFSYLGLSVAVHGLLLLFISRWELPFAQPFSRRRVILNFVSPLELPQAVSRKKSSESRDFPVDTAKLPPPQQAAKSAFLPVLPLKRAELKRAENRVVRKRTAEITQPDFLDILNQVSSSEEKASAGIERAAASPGGIVSQKEIDWSTEQRELLKKSLPSFPNRLILAGLEVDVEALITVSPAGYVTGVEITRSSGYTLIDNAVTTALRDYLFEKSESIESDTGLIRFHFRLER